MSDVANSHYSAAAELYRQGKLEDAIKELKQAIDLEPGHLKAYITLGAIYEAKKRFDKAIEAYRDALVVEIDDPRANYRLGVLLMRAENYLDALTPLRMAWSNDQKNPHVASALAFALDKTGDFATAQIMYEAALKLDSKMTDVRFNLGTLYFHQKRYESAITCFVTYMVKVGDDSKAHRNIGKAQLQLGQLRSAIQSFGRAAALDPTYPKNYYNIALVYDMLNELDEAVTYYRTVLTLNPAQTEARYRLAKALRSTGKIDEAVCEFQVLIEQDPEHHKALNSLATCYIDRRDLTEAMGLLNQAIAVNPSYSLAHYNLGVVLSTMANTDAALYHFQEALRLDPSDDATAVAIEQLLNRTASRTNNY